MLLLLIRHGLTGETGARLTGWTPGVSLSKEGRAQAESVAERLDGVEIDAIYASPLERCQETAAPLARVRKLRLRTREDLGEVRYGEIQGKSYKVLAKSKLWRHLAAWPSDLRFPGGETLRETQARAVSAIEALRDKHMKDTVAVFSHADWIRLAAAHFMGVHVDLYRRVTIDPASVSAFAFYPLGVQVRLLNDTGSITNIAGGPPARPPSDRARGSKR